MSKQQDLDDTDPLEQWERPEYTTLLATVGVYGGQPRLHLRLWCDTGGEWHPTRRGVWFAPEELDQLAAVVARAKSLLAEWKEAKGPQGGGED
jgi:hypothetical protein